MLNSFVDELEAPVIPMAQAWGQAYDGSKGPLIDLSQAAPGYPPPAEMLAWLGEAAASPEFAGYGPTPGEQALRETYATHVSAIYNTKLTADQTHITSGCNQAFIVAAMAVAGAGDTVLMTNPCYFNHEASLSMLGIKSAYVDCNSDNGFLPDIEDIRSALKGVKAFAIVSPNNPTGCIYPKSLLQKIYQACRDADVWLILDETYRDFMASDERHALFENADWQDGLIQLYSFSKSFCIPGHRLGAVVAGEPVINAIFKVMDNLQICAPRAAQSAVAKAIVPLADWREANRLEIQNRASAMRKAFAELTGWQINSIGAYFAFVQHPFEGRSSIDVAKAMAEQAGVSCLPGAFFGENQDKFLRIAFANADVKTIGLLKGRLQAFSL